jgi:cytochrome d ubiquinol oxidase subunit II
MDLNTIWFVLISVLFTGFFLLEGFDYGVGILLPFLGRDDTERRMIINTIGPVWDGNEVWMITAGGAMFAAFPHWYATMFSGYYLALVLLLLALIMRGVAFELRSKVASPAWRATWDRAIFVGSFVPALLWGVAMVNLVRGLPINAEMDYVGSFFDLLNPLALVAGLTTLTVFILHGAVFLMLKIGSGIEERARTVAMRLWPVAVLLMLLVIVLGYLQTDFVARVGINPGVIPITAVVALLLSRWFIGERRPGWAFILTSATIVFSTVTLFIGLFPRVMVSSLAAEHSLTIYNASSSPHTLKLMTIVACLLVPVVLVYQGWTYWVFRERIVRETPLEY